MKNQSTDKIIEKMRKVLELSKNNPSPAEAEAAALKAQKLMAEYHISMKEVEAVESFEEITERPIYVGTGNKWKSFLADIVGKNFRCKYFLYGRSTIVFYGYEEDTKIAAMTFEFLFTTGKKAAANYYQKKRNYAMKQQGYFHGSGIRNAFLIGYLEGIEESLGRQCTALMLTVPREVEESYFNRTNGFHKASNNLSYGSSAEGQRAREEGKKAGKTVIISRSIEASD